MYVCTDKEIFNQIHLLTIDQYHPQEAVYKNNKEKL